MLSIIITTYNRQYKIQRALKSILEQDLQEIEIIIIDDGSTDQTSSVIKNFEQKSHHPIKYFHQNNQGCASARNTGLQFASGQFIHFLDSDDELTKSGIKALYDTLTNCDADFAFSPSIERYSTGLRRVNKPVAWSNPDRLAWNHFFYPNLRIGTALYKNYIFETLKGFDASLKYNEDSDFHQRLAIDFKGIYSKTPSVIVHHHSNSKSRNRVEINNALIQSYNNILNQYPKFKAILAEEVNTRLEDLHIDLIVSLIKNNQWKTMKEIQKKYKLEKLFWINIAYKFKSKWPLIFYYCSKHKLKYWYRLIFA